MNDLRPFLHVLRRALCGQGSRLLARAFVELNRAAAERVSALLAAGFACDTNLVAMLSLDVCGFVPPVQSQVHVSVMPLRETCVCLACLWVHACPDLLPLFCFRPGCRESSIHLPSTTLFSAPSAPAVHSACECILSGWHNPRDVCAPQCLPLGRPLAPLVICSMPACLLSVSS